MVRIHPELCQFRSGMRYPAVDVDWRAAIQLVVRSSIRCSSWSRATSSRLGSPDRLCLTSTARPQADPRPATPGYRVRLSARTAARAPSGLRPVIGPLRPELAAGLEWAGARCSPHIEWLRIADRVGATGLEPATAWTTTRCGIAVGYGSVGERRFRNGFGPSLAVLIPVAYRMFRYHLVVTRRWGSPASGALSLSGESGRAGAISLWHDERAPARLRESS
jgi:hypothetical protein